MKRTLLGPTKPARSLSTEVVRKLEFELAYLSLLTREGLKPLSRWEKAFDRSAEEQLQALGLKTRVVERSVQSGQRVRELLFSSSDECLSLYASRFDRTAIQRNREDQRIEGLLFGYPRCCVESYLDHGYARNSLRRRDQRILFHWACPRCAITPLLLPEYRRVFRSCRAAMRGEVCHAIPRLLTSAFTPRLKRSLATAVSLTALGLVPAATLSVVADPPDPHVLALGDDADADFLRDGEEIVLGYDPSSADQNANGVPDGVDLAQRLSQTVDALPTAPSATNAFVTHHEAFGFENCLVCGDPVNMGFLEVCRPLENQTVEIPYVAKHFLEHGSFSYSGSLHSGRINPPLLNFILNTEGEGHFIAEPAGTDADRDGLRDWEEPAFGSDPQKPDTDGNLLLDGVDTARELRHALEALPAVGRRDDGPLDRPFVVPQWMNGIETCPRCGEVQTMGLWEVIHPLTGESVTIPTMAIHYLEHGAFGWHGGELLGGQGRVDPRQLQAILTGQPNRHLLAVTVDQDGDFLADPEEMSLGMDPVHADEDGNGVVDGLDLARVLVCEIAGLPTTPSSNQVYRLDFPLRGLERCETCGASVNMGHLTVCNPQAQLTVEVPYIALHYLEHDSISFAGDVHGTGRSGVKDLVEVLFRPAVSVVADGEQVTLRWMTRAGRSYQIFTASDIQGPWTGGPAFQGDGTEHVYTETQSPGTTRSFFKVIVW
jgi:hypothetical protein